MSRAYEMGRTGWISRLALGLVALGYCTEIFASFDPRAPRAGRRAAFPWRETPSCPELISHVSLVNLPVDPKHPNTQSRLYFLKSPHPEAYLRPVQVLISGGPGLSFRTLSPLTELNAKFDLAFMDPPGVGEGAFLAFENDLGNQYDRVVEDIARTIHDEIEVKMNRDVALVGFSSGGVLAGEAIARHSNTILTRVKGLVLLAASMTDKSYRALCQIRENHHLYNEAYQWTKNRVALFPQPHITPFIRTVARRRWDTEPTDEEIKQVQMAMNRDNFIQWILAHGNLIWNDDEEDEVSWLICTDADYCSPESISKLIKNWKQDRLRGDVTATALKNSGVRVLSIIGGKDRLIPSNYLLEDAEKMGAATVVVEGGSHFVYVSDLEKVTEAIYRFYLIPSE
jgi:pimeloyl-ACP methyl ester carboxylesterase